MLTPRVGNFCKLGLVKWVRFASWHCKHRYTELYIYLWRCQNQVEATTPSSFESVAALQGWFHSLETLRCLSYRQRPYRCGMFENWGCFLSTFPNQLGKHAVWGRLGVNKESAHFKNYADNMNRTGGAVARTPRALCLALGKINN